ncbi:MAG: Wzz/FepE/Etk N-terminal domain-containing protein [Candidatus Omnitrophica bacterium]|nr:Wzz/FepE/Etk N-terminal domain-containing protein [Candidatus Omnitrophota bacterium]
MNNQQIEAEDEINLADYINVIIKRKTLILVVFLVLVITTAIRSFLMPEVYEVSMIIEPPILAVTNAGVQNFDSAENIKAKIQEGAFNKAIIKDLNLKEDNLKFDIVQPKDTRLIKVSLEARAKKTALGLAVLNKLLEKLNLNYSKFIENKKNAIDAQIGTVNGQINAKRNQIKLKEEQLKIQEDREQRLLDEVKETKSNSEKLVVGRGALLEKKDSKEDISALLYSNIIQQNIGYSIQLQNQISDLRVGKENVKTETKNYENDINSLEIEIEKLTIEKNQISNLGIIQEPQVSLYAIRPNRKQNVIIGALLGLMTGVFLAFSMEWWKVSKKT